MPAEPVPVKEPEHPLHALTTYELRDYRRDLETSLATLPEHAQERPLLQQRLAEVLAEQVDRMDIARQAKSELSDAAP